LPGSRPRPRTAPYILTGPPSSPFSRARAARSSSEAPPGAGAWRLHEQLLALMTWPSRRGQHMCRLAWVGHSGFGSSARLTPDR
jgi:hypothetical protein